MSEDYPNACIYSTVSNKWYKFVEGDFRFIDENDVPDEIPKIYRNMALIMS